MTFGLDEDLAAPHRIVLCGGLIAQTDLAAADSDVLSERTPERTGQSTAGARGHDEDAEVTADK